MGKEPPDDGQDVIRRLGLQPKADHTVVYISAPVSSLGKIHIKSHNRKTILYGPPEERLVVTFTKTGIGRMHYRVAILAKRFSNFNPNILVD